MNSPASLLLLQLYILYKEVEKCEPFLNELAMYFAVCHQLPHRYSWHSIPELAQQEYERRKLENKMDVVNNYKHILTKFVQGNVTKEDMLQLPPDLLSILILVSRQSEFDSSMRYNCLSLNQIINLTRIEHVEGVKLHFYINDRIVCSWINDHSQLIWKDLQHLLHVRFEWEKLEDKRHKMNRHLLVNAGIFGILPRVGDIVYISGYPSQHYEVIGMREDGRVLVKQGINEYTLKELITKKPGRRFVVTQKGVGVELTSEKLINWCVKRGKYIDHAD